MPSDRITGAALIAGALASLVTMAMHPTAADLARDFDGVLVVASSSAILLWSAAILATRALARWAGVLGVVVGGLVLLAFLSGRVGLDVHGFGLIVLAQGVWLVAVGVLLLRAK